jgi:hypothetical protein
MNKDAYQAVLSDLRQEVARLMALIEGIERQMAKADGGSAGAGPSVPASDRNGSQSAPYARMTIPDAAKAFLISARGAPQSPRAMANAVRAGGHPTKAKHLEANLRTVMVRHFKDDPEIAKTRRGWWRYKAPISPEVQ